MTKKFKSAWALLVICWRVLMLDREMLVFPILSLAALVLTLVGGGLPLYLAGLFDPVLDMLASESDGGNEVVVAAIGYVIYVLTTFIFLFFNTALIACARIRFAGGDPTVRDGLSAAWGLLPQIAGWALVTATVGFILKKLSDNNKGIGGLIFGILGAGWTIAAYFVVPILVADRVGPIRAMRSSAALIRKTWGETLVAEIGLSAVSFVVILPAFGLIMLGMILLDGNPAISFLLFAVAVATIMSLMLVMSTLDAILRAALFVYASEGKMPDQFDPQAFRTAFRQKGDDD